MTIKERVKVSWTNYIYRDVPATRLYQSVYEDGYINGANEQRKIDIKCICDYLTGHVFKNVKGEQIHGGFIAECIKKDLEYE